MHLPGFRKGRFTRPDPEDRAVAMKALRAVIFDLDGVLTDTARFHYLGWKRLADETGRTFDEKFNERFKGVSRIECAKMLFPDEKDLVRLSTLADRKNRYFVEMVETLTPKDLFPGVSDLLTALKNVKILSAVASASRNAGRILEKLEALPLFDVVVDGNDVKRSKPAPDCFLRAAVKLGVPAEHCVVVEDAEAGVEAAHNAGMAVVGIGALPKADALVTVFQEITLELLKGIQQ
jgi:beta-phosphoglucomutase